MKVLISHPTGNQNVRAAAMGFVELGIPISFHTTIATFSGDVFDRLSELNAFSALSRRRYDDRIRNFTITSPWREMGRLISSRFGLYNLTRGERGVFSIDSVYRSLDKRVATTLTTRNGSATDAVYCYEDGALFSFRKAKELGIRCFYDLPIGYWRAGRSMMQEEKERWPDWASTLTGLYDSEEKLARKDEEISLADKIYVASQFTSETLKRFPGRLPQIDVVPYGFPPVAISRRFSTADGTQPLKVLFVGSLTQRKGIADVFAAVESLKRHVKLTVIGSETGNACQVLSRALAKHRWIRSLPHEEILREMQLHDVLVFPSLFEGFGLVITEAMAQGTPVITTERTAGPDLIENGVNGWIIKAGSTEALQGAIEHLLENRKCISVCGQAAMETARLRPWTVYGKTVAESAQREMKMATSERRL